MYMLPWNARQSSNTWAILQLTYICAASHLQLSCLEVPPAWRKVDFLKEARATQLHLFENRSQRQLMEEVFFLKRLQTIRDFFKLCATFAQTLSGKVVYTLWWTLFQFIMWNPLSQFLSIGMRRDFPCIVQFVARLSLRASAKFAKGQLRMINYCNSFFQNCLVCSLKYLIKYGISSI